MDIEIKGKMKIITLKMIRNLWRRENKNGYRGKGEFKISLLFLGIIAFFVVVLVVSSMIK